MTQGRNLERVMIYNPNVKVILTDIEKNQRVLQCVLKGYWICLLLQQQFLEALLSKRLVQGITPSSFTAVLDATKRPSRKLICYTRGPCSTFVLSYLEQDEIAPVSNVFYIFLNLIKPVPQNRVLWNTKTYTVSTYKTTYVSTTNTY